MLEVSSANNINMYIIRPPNIYIIAQETRGLEEVGSLGMVQPNVEGTAYPGLHILHINIILAHFSTLQLIRKIWLFNQ